MTRLEFMQGYALAVTRQDALSSMRKTDTGIALDAIRLWETLSRIDSSMPDPTRKEAPE